MLWDLNFLNCFNNISSLRVIGLYSNNFGGVLPNSIVNLSLQHFTIGNNRISGNIPGDIRPELELQLNWISEFKTIGLELEQAIRPAPVLPWQHDPERF